MDRLSCIRVFARVVETGSFTAAGERLGLARAAASKAVALLEKDLGVQLLERTTRRVRVTDAGAAYYGKCVRILADLDEADDAARSLHGEPRGTLRVNAPISFGVLHLQPLMPTFLARHPDLRLSLSLTDRFVDVVEEGYDVVVRIARLTDSSLIARRIAPACRMIVASPSYLERAGAPATPADLEGHACLLYGSEPQEQEWVLNGPGGRHSVHVSGPLASNNGDVLCGAAVAGLGITMLPTYVAAPELRAGRLVPVLPEYRPPEISVYAIYPPNRHLSAKVRSFIDFLVGHFGQRPFWDHEQGEVGLRAA